jgi:hypothetical protein
MVTYAAVSIAVKQPKGTYALVVIATFYFDNNIKLYLKTSQIPIVNIQ